ncbi:MAG TPA: ATP-binding protein [Solirubrobacteraceae bacterium]|jgi:signal transduction histidine kinase
MSAGARSSSVQRPRLALWVVAALCAVATVVFVGYGAGQIWQLHTADAALRSAIETGITLSALVSAALLLAHFRQTRMLRDLLLLAGLATTALTDFIFNALPAYHYQTGIYGAGARMALTILIAGTFLAVAFAPGDREVQAGRRLAAIAVPAAFYFVALGELVDLIAGPVRERGPSGAYGPVATSLSLICCVLLLISAGGFAVRHRDGDRAAGLLTIVALCLAGAQLGMLGLGVAPPDWVTPSDALRVAAYGLLLAAAVGMYRRSQDQVARDAVSAERLRIARDLHDGLAQDLAFIAAHSERLAREFGADHPLAIAATRALAASRGQIVDLEASEAASTEAALREVASEISSRHGVNVSVTVDGGAQPEQSDHERTELVRIAREAIANAVRHGGARNVTVRLGSRRNDLLLRVSDDGCGFGGSRRTAGTGLGMRTMRARAESVGGRLVTRTRASGGAEIEVRSGE